MSRSSLSGLSDRELLGRLKSLVEKERATTVEILLHLNEVRQRRLYLTLGYPSLFEYCTRHLGYSSSAAGRRTAAARCVRDYPEVLGLLEKNEVTLVTVSRVAGILTPENREDLLEKLRGKSEAEIDEILSGYRPPTALRDRVKSVRVAVPVPQPGGARDSGQSCPVTPTGGSEISPSAAASAAGVARDPSVSTSMTQALRQPSTQAPALPPTRTTTTRLERRFQIQFLATEAFMKKFEKARALLSNRLDERSFEKVFEAMMDEFLDRHSPEKRQERREKRVAKRQEPTKRREKADEGRDNRHIPAPVRDAVFQRDEGRCTYVGTTGERCGSTHNLQVDHIVPYARGGIATPDNVRLLCAKHNRLEAERVYGADAIRQYRLRE